MARAHVPKPVRRSAVRFRTLSLRSRLVLLAVALAVLGLAASDTVVLGSIRGQLVHRVDQKLRRYGKPVARKVADGGGLSDSDLHRARGGSSLSGPYAVAFADADGTVTEQFGPALTEGAAFPGWPSMDGAQLRARAGKAFTLPGDDSGSPWRVLVLSVGNAIGNSVDTTDDTADPPAAVLVATSLEETDATAAQMRDAFLLIGAIVVTLLGLGGWFAVGAGLRPLHRIEAAAGEIAAGRPLSHRMPDASPHTETGRLASVLNSMLTQIESAFAARSQSEQRMRRFIADASHELRTPLVSIRGFAELYRMGALSDEADIKRTMDRIESEAVRMGRLVEDLLLLAQLDEQRPLQLAPMDLRTLAVDALHDATALDPTRPVSLTGPGGPGTSPGPAPVLGDEARLRQVVTNLVGNAIAHTPPGTLLRIGVGTAADTTRVIEVADSGPGLPPDQAARVFDRFYRVDASRSRQEGGGAGLGLAIASALVTAHQGNMELETAPGQGALFRVRLPRDGGDTST
ncbi:HAMP domain-containing sensor histidine kinase [Streptomyces sp. NPDC048277]|uniref:sensor histidine kinase n=1 Tax=Streptomyces sp. NPDC048277 TaxID=3155027 RepID=UPI0034080036